jgi:hypothetical protein
MATEASTVPPGGALAGTAPMAAVRPYRVPLRSRLGGVVFILPGVAWLAIFFILPLFIIVAVSFATRDPAGHVTFANPTLDNYLTATRPEYLTALWNSLRYAAITTILSILIGYPIAYWISRYGGARKNLLLVLVMLPFWTSYLIRTYAWMIILRDTGVLNSVLQGVGLGDPDNPLRLLNTDFSVILGLTYGFLPFAILPLFVSIDRLDSEPRPRRAGPLRERAPGVPPRDPAADHAGDHRRGPPHLHPGDRRLRDAGPAAEPRRRRSPRSCRSSSRAAAIGRRARPSASSS